MEERGVLDEVTVDGVGIEDIQYLSLREDLESDVRDFGTPTWSLSVDQHYVRSFSKDAISRQDVIHELIQTEINHVRTLKLMLCVYVRELRDSLLMDEAQLERVFPRLDRLLQEHQHFLQSLKHRRRESLEAGSDINYCISNIGDILIAQFSDDHRIRLQDSYGVFCSRHSEAVNFYKEQLQNNKKFQSLMQRIRQLSIMRRLGIPEGILLITQRITKYPVLLERIIKNTEAGTQEHADLVNALERIKDMISTVDTQVHQYEQLREIAAQLEPKSCSRMSNGKMFRRDDVLQNDRKLLREGVMTWRPQNRTKAFDVLMVLLPDLLLLFQEKDQKYIFASLDGKPAVLPLQKLIVREAAHSDKAIYLISASDVNAELYEFHTSSAEERSSWRQQIWETIERCSHVDDELMEQDDVYPDRLRELHDQLYERDAQIEEILRQKLQIFTDMSEVLTENSTTARRLLLRGSASELQQGELFINNAIIQAEQLQMQLMNREIKLIPPSGDINLHHNSQTLPVYNRTEKIETSVIQLLVTACLFEAHKSDQERNKDCPKLDADGFRSRDQRPNSDPHLRDLYLHHLETDDEGSMFPPEHSIRSEWIDSADKLIRMLYSLKALVSQQDSELEALRASHLERERPSRQRHGTIQDQERQRHLEKQREELLHLQKLHMQQKQEQEEWARERQRHLLAMHEREQELTRCMDECTNKEAWLSAERDVLNRCREEYQQDLERLRDCTRTVEKEREKLEQEKRRFQKHKSLTNRGGVSHQAGAPKMFTQGAVLYTSHDAVLSSRAVPQPTLPQERPPVVPPRKESMNVGAIVKAEVPIQLLSTTNEALKSSSIQQQIPTKLAISKAKDKSKSSHHRTNSAATIEVGEIFPFKVSGQEGGSLRAMKLSNPHTHTADIYPEHSVNSKLQSSSQQRAPNQQRAPSQQRALSEMQEDILLL